ncbi:MAG: ABC-F family ATP-binding cassette domain-containing protein [Gemmatimonadales bacterium]|nr:ABC-F family ATP-binding cassette domain-containing protein [Gemmatimonadales bacterium]
MKDVTFTIAAGERWGIVGRNGAGKTTLFKLVTGQLQPTRGAIARAPRLRFALLDQHRDFGPAATVWEAAAHGYADLVALEQSLARQGERLAELGEAVTEADLERFGADQERFAHAGGYEFHARVDKVLQGLGFDAEEAKVRPLARLSGGERGRVGLAAQLAAPADVVLLDEPTNHLDLDTIDWLKRYLGEFGETVLVISHDRAFLDDSVDHVLHVSGGTATAYRGGYTSFVTQRTERLLAQERALANQQKAIAKEEDYIRRNIAGGNSAQAKGRRRRLERLPRLSPPPGEAGAMSLRLEAAARGGDQVIVADRLVVKVGERTLLRDFTAVARRGDVIALVGPNGAGKSTLIATLLGERPPAAGTGGLGGSIAPAWFRQDLADLPTDQSVYDCIAHLRPEWGRGPIQGHLGAFGFSGDEVLRKTSVLSGGERARLALAIMVLAHANLLVLDEPTNHLDVESIEALEDALEAYEGTVLLVSHDRAFLRELATRVWAFDGVRMLDYDGPFADWERDAAARADRRAAEASAQAAADRQRDRAAKQAKAAEAPKGEAQLQRAAAREVERLAKQVEQAERTVAGLEAAIADPALADGSVASGRRLKALGAELDAARRTLERAMEAWVAAG